jgi:hypothetical protein
VEIPKSLIERAAYEADLDLETNLTFTYSGRYMYGRQCFGVIGTLEDYGKFLLMLAEAEANAGNFYGGELAWELAQGVSTDNMGFDTIYYFPSVKVTDGDSTESDA